MNKLLISAMLFSLSTSAFAECNLAKDLIPLPNGVQYSFGCHQLVGKTFMDNEDRKTQIKLQQTQIDLLTQRVVLETQRAELWENTSLQMKKDFDSYRDAQRYNGYVMFGLGVVSTVLTAYAIRQATK